MNCHSDKRPYKTRKQAMRSVTTGRAKGLRVHAYKCPLCHSWHLASGDHPLKKKDFEERRDYKHSLESRDGLAWLARKLGS